MNGRLQNTFSRNSIYHGNGSTPLDPTRRNSTRVGEHAHSRAPRHVEGRPKARIQVTVRRESLDVGALYEEEYRRIHSSPSLPRQFPHVMGPSYRGSIREERGGPDSQVGTLDLHQSDQLVFSSKPSEIESMTTYRDFPTPRGCSSERVDRLAVQDRSHQSIGHSRINGDPGPTVADGHEIELRLSPRVRFDGDHRTFGHPGNEEFFHPPRIRDVDEKFSPLQAAPHGGEEAVRTPQELHSFRAALIASLESHGTIQFSKPGPRSSRAINNRRISLVPAPISRSLASRASRSSG